MGKYNIQSFTVPGTVIVVATDADEILTDAFELNGILRGIKVTSPDLDDTDTFTLKLEDDGVFVLFSKASIAEGAKTFIYVDANNVPLAIPLTGNHKIRITASGDQAADRTFVVKLLVDRG